MWEPIGKVTADFELMIKDTDWVNFAGGTNWHGRQARKDHELEGTVVGDEAIKIINHISDGSWHYVLNRTLNNNITKPHKDWGYEVPWDRYTWNLKDRVIEESSREEKLELAKKWRRFWIPMRDREFGQFFESFAEVFSQVSGMSANKENVILIQYSLCFKHIGLLTNKRKIKDCSAFSGTFFKMVTDMIFSSILSRLCLRFGSLFEARIAKNGD